MTRAEERTQKEVLAALTGGIATPAGSATSAKQDIGNASLASIDSKMTATANARTNVLAAEDVVATYTYLGFGTADQRLSTIVYTSASYPTDTITKTFNYVLDGSSYRLTTVVWS